MAKGKDELIPDFDTSWEGYSGKRIEEFIKAQFEQVRTETDDALKLKPGYFKRSDEKGSDNNYHIYGFATEADYMEWNSDPDTYANLLLSDVALPDTGSGSSAISYIVNLYRDSSSDIVTIDKTVKLKIRFTSQEYNPITQTSQDTTEGGTLTVQSRTSSTGTWSTRGTVAIASMSASSEDWTEVDITNMLNDGSQQVRIIVKGDTTELNTRYLQFNVTKTTLGLTFATQWEKPITDGVMRLNYYITGAVSKTLNIRIDGTRKLEYNLGTSVYTESARQIEVSDSSTDTVKVITQGLHTIEAWLSVNNSTVESEHLHSEVLVITDTSDKTVYLILNDVASGLTNWTSQQILSYAIYNPNASSTPFSVTLCDYSGESEYMQLDLGNISNNTKYELSNVVEIDSEETTIDAYMHFYSEGKEIRTMLGFEVDNAENFSPTSGADLVINPRLRTNQEEKPASIINTATGEILTSTWEGFRFKNDGWVTDDDGNRCLRIPAGRLLTIQYEAFQDYIGTDNKSSLTLEFDFATRNITDMDAAILRMCTYMSDQLPLGFEMKPTDACFMTEANRVYDDQDAGFQEGERTHMAVNIIYGINNTSKNYVRIFINGVINREFEWTVKDNFVQYVNSKKTSLGIRIGNNTSDIDIYGLRVYRKSLSAEDVRQDYMASLPTVAEKLAFREANNILGDDNTINYSKTYEKYNTMLITGTVPSYVTGNVKFTNDVDINIIGDPAHSGTLYSVTTSGQGTSSRSYWLWNFQFAMGDASYWIDGNGERHTGYQLFDGMPYGLKLCAKRNWASSMQSHKMGAVNLYTDLWKRCTGGSSITNTPGFEGCRVTVAQKPFMVFVRATEDDEPTFYGLYTFGPGKGDKPTFGYDKKVFPDYLMLEGCDNGEPLTNHRIPWNDDITFDGEVYRYNGSKQWEVSMGNTESISYFIDAFNFIYLHTPHIKPWVGTLATLQASTSETADHQTLYWVTQSSTGSNKFDLYRFDALTNTWVDAGVEKIDVGKYEKLSLSSQTGISPSGNVWDDINEQFINARVADFKDKAANYVKVDDGLFHSNFGLLIAASDNRAKNTYLYLAEYNGNLVIHWAQDDLDTILPTDNVGRKNKPYYVEVHDVDSSGSTYWNGEQNALYDLLEQAYPSEMRSMMNTMLTQMADLAKDYSDETDKLLDCMEKYFFSTQRYFPAVAYNETARISYEAAAAIWGNGYTASTHPITQSLGDQLQCELQWVRLRLTYLSSYASYGDFAMNGTNSLTFRSIQTLNGAQPTYSFDLTPHIWLYPAISKGSSLAFGQDENGLSYSAPQRVKAGEMFTLSGVESDGNTNLQICGIDQYKSIGEFGNKPVEGDSFVVAGERLTEFHASQLPMEFRPPKVTVTAPLLTVFDIKGASSVKGNIDFSACKRLESIDISGTSVTSFDVADATLITELHLPDTLTTLNLVDYTDLTEDNFSFGDVGDLQSFTFSGCDKLNSQSVVENLCATENFRLNYCSIDGINWTDFSLTYLMRLLDVDDITMKGKISLKTSEVISCAQKRLINKQLGNVDSEDNTLYIKYNQIVLQSLTLSGEHYIAEPGDYQLDWMPNTTRANNFISETWEISKNNYATIDAKTGILTVNKVSTEDIAPKATVKLTVKLTNGNEVSNTMEIGFYNRSAHLGDYVYADGSYSDFWDKNKTVVGICFYIDRSAPENRLAVACSDTYDAIQWGLYPNADSGCYPITLESNPSYSVYDISSISNITSRGLIATSTGNASNYVSDDTMRDEETGDDDGFKIMSNNTAAGDLGFTVLTVDYGEYKKGDRIPIGLLKTLKIIAHRDTILTDPAVNLEVPFANSEHTEMEHLKALMTQIVTEKGSSKYRQYYYPAPSLCHAYQPTVKTGEVLSPLFLAGKWFLPASGDLFRLIWYARKGYTVDTDNAIFAIAKTNAVFTAFTSTYYWAATEYSSYYAWYAGFSDGNTSYGSKCYSSRVRAVVAF